MAELFAGRISDSGFSRSNVEDMIGQTAANIRKYENAILEQQWGLDESIELRAIETLRSHYEWRPEGAQPLTEAAVVAHASILDREAELRCILKEKARSLLESTLLALERAKMSALDEMLAILVQRDGDDRP